MLVKLPDAEPVAMGAGPSSVQTVSLNGIDVEGRFRLSRLTNRSGNDDRKARARTMIVIPNRCPAKLRPNQDDTAPAMARRVPCFELAATPLPVAPVPECTATATMGVGDKANATCQAFLDTSERARFQWELEHRFRVFESYQ